MHVLACIGRFRLQADTLDYLQHVQQYTCIVATEIAHFNRLTVRMNADTGYGIYQV
jgi:hypothetical protein